MTGSCVLSSMLNWATCSPVSSWLVMASPPSSRTTRSPGSVITTSPAAPDSTPGTAIRSAMASSDSWAKSRVRLSLGMTGSMGALHSKKRRAVQVWGQLPCARRRALMDQGPSSALRGTFSQGRPMAAACGGDRRGIETCRRHAITAKHAPPARARLCTTQGAGRGLDQEGRQGYFGTAHRRRPRLGCAQRYYGKQRRGCRGLICATRRRVCRQSLRRRSGSRNKDDQPAAKMPAAALQEKRNA